MLEESSTLVVFASTGMKGSRPSQRMACIPQPNQELASKCMSDEDEQSIPQYVQLDKMYNSP
jgi:hypothetical protein